MVVVTIVGAAGVAAAELLLKLLLVVVVAVLVILVETGTRTLLLDTGGAGPHVALFVADVDASVGTGVTITLLGGCWIPAVVAVTVVADMAVDEAMVIRGGGTIFIGCWGCWS